MSASFDPATMVAIIPARGGSKGLAGKNLSIVGGQTLVARALHGALASGVCGDVVLTTDSNAIAQEAEGLPVRVIRRPANLAEDDSLTIDAVLHALAQLAQEGKRPRGLVLLQPTSPLRGAEQIAAAVELWHQKQAASVVSVTEVEHHPYKMLRVTDGGLLQPLFDLPSLSAPRQTLPTILRQNGAIYVCDVEALKSNRSFYLAPCYPFPMNKVSSIDVDDAFDLLVARAVAEKRS